MFFGFFSTFQHTKHGVVGFFRQKANCKVHPGLILPLLPAAGVTWSRIRSMRRGWMIPASGEQHPCPVPAVTDTLRTPLGISLPISTASVKFAAGSRQSLSISLTTARPEAPPPAFPRSMESFSLTSWLGVRAMRSTWMVLSHFDSLHNIYGCRECKIQLCLSGRDEMNSKGLSHLQPFHDSDSTP